MRHVLIASPSMTIAVAEHRNGLSARQAVALAAAAGVVISKCAGASRRVQASSHALRVWHRHGSSNPADREMSWPLSSGDNHALLAWGRWRRGAHVGIIALSHHRPNKMSGVISVNVISRRHGIWLSIPEENMYCGGIIESICGIMPSKRRINHDSKRGKMGDTDSRQSQYSGACPALA